MKTRGMKRQGTPTRKPQEAKDDASAEETESDSAEQRASMRAWVQYARALFSVAEFRFVD